MHSHIWIRDLARGRYTCACGVIGHTAQNLPGQYRTDTKYIQPYRCYAKRDGKQCSAEAVHVTGDRQASRCREHAPAKVSAA